MSELIPSVPFEITSEDVDLSLERAVSGSICRNCPTAIALTRLSGTPVSIGFETVKDIPPDSRTDGRRFAVTGDALRAQIHHFTVAIHGVTNLDSAFAPGTYELRDVDPDFAAAIERGKGGAAMNGTDLNALLVKHGHPSDADVDGVVSQDMEALASDLTERISKKRDGQIVEDLHLKARDLKGYADDMAAEGRYVPEARAGMRATALLDYAIRLRNGELP